MRTVDQPRLSRFSTTTSPIQRLGRDMFAREKEAQDRIAQGHDILSILMRQRTIMHGDQRVTDEMLDHVTTFVMVRLESQPFETSSHRYAGWT